MNEKLKTSLNEDMLLPAFDKNNVAVLFSLTDNYIPVFSVCLLSMLQHFSPNCNYDIIMFERTVTNENKDILLSMIKDYQNVSLRFYNPEALFADDTDYNDRFPIDTRFRMMAPFILPKHKKILFFDADILVCTDIAFLFDTDISSYYAAGVLDLAAVGKENENPENSFSLYVKETLQIASVEKYINAGIMLLNLEMIRTRFSVDDFKSIMTKQQYLYPEQDILNVMFYSKILFLNIEWNTFVRSSPNMASAYEHVSEELYNEYLQARKSPKIIHYLGGSNLKPWCRSNGDFVINFWNTARPSPYYEQLLGIMIYTKNAYIERRLRNELHSAMDRCLKSSLKRLLINVSYIFLPLNSKRRGIVKTMYYKLFSKK